MSKAPETPTNGGPELVAELWSRFATGLRGWFESRVRDADEAEDLLQETFLRLQRGASGLRDSDDMGRVGAWVRTVARNVLIDRYRRDGRPTESLDPEAMPAQPTQEGDLAPTVALWLEPMMEALAQEDREVLRLSELEGRTAREIAGRTGLSVSGVKSRVQRGRAKLRGLLLACCRFEFDRRGGIVDVRRQTGGGCAGDDCEQEGC